MVTFIKDVDANGDAGTATKVGGNDWSKLDHYFGDVDIGLIAKINTETWFRDGKFKFRDSGNDHNLTIVMPNLAAHRNLNIPLMTADDSMALVAFAQTFTNKSISGSTNTLSNISTSSIDWSGGLQIQREGQGDFLNLYRTDNSVGNNVNINYRADNSINALTEYARIAMEIVDATDGSEDGRLEFSTRTNDVLTEKMLIHDTGDVDITTGKFTITRDANAVLFDLYRTDNAVTNGIIVDFNLQDSANNKTSYSQIRSIITDATNGSEDGNFEIWTSRAGTITRAARFGELGDVKIDGSSTLQDLLAIYRPTNTLNDAIDINFNMNNSAATEVTYADLRTYIIEDNSGSEQGKFGINVMHDGTKEEMLALVDGKLLVGDAINGIGAVPRTYIKSGSGVSVTNTVTETTLFSQNIVAGQLGANGNVKLYLYGSFRNNNASTCTYRLRCKFGGTSWYSNIVASITGADADYAVWNLVALVANQNDTSAQICHGRWFCNNPEAADTGWGPVSDDEIMSAGAFAGNTTKDTAGSNNSISVTIEMSSANANTGTFVDYKELIVNP